LIGGVVGGCVVLVAVVALIAARAKAHKRNSLGDSSGTHTPTHGSLARNPVGQAAF